MQTERKRFYSPEGKTHCQLGFTRDLVEEAGFDGRDWVNIIYIPGEKGEKGRGKIVITKNIDEFLKEPGEVDGLK